MVDTIRLIVGLGNPGQEYLGTRHNTGEKFVHRLATILKSNDLKYDIKFFSKTTRVTAYNKELRLIVPTTFMNESGKAVAAYSSFFKIDPEEILVVHDDLDIPAGKARFKVGGGHGGHKGLRHIISALGNNSAFCRLRIGIGHPGSASQVTSYVLSKPTKIENSNINAAIDKAASLIPFLLEGNMMRAMEKLHLKTVSGENSVEEILDGL